MKDAAQNVTANKTEWGLYPRGNTLSQYIVWEFVFKVNLSIVPKEILYVNPGE